MDCLPGVAKRCRRILRKMFPSRKVSNDWERLRHDSDKENLQPDHSYCLSSSLSSSSKSYAEYSPREAFNNADKTFVVPETILNKNDNTDGVGSFSSGFGSWMSPSPPRTPFKIHEDRELSQSFDYWLKPIRSYSENSVNSSDSPQSIPYSPLNSFNFADPTNMPSAFFSNFNLDFTPPKAEQSETDEIQCDFERNGRTIEINEPVFVPSAASTPMIHRRMWQMHQQQTTDFYQPLQQQMQPQQQSTFKQPIFHQRKKIRPNKKSLEDHCVFCKNNGADKRIYGSHTVKDALGRVICPTLRLYKCPICGENGDNAHTVKYCPKKPIITEHDTQQMSKPSF